MNRWPSFATGVAIAVALALAAAASRADTRSDYSIFCLDLSASNSTPFLYPSSANANAGSHGTNGGSFAWDLRSDAWMPSAGFPFLTQAAEAAAAFQNVPIEFGPGCQFFAGSESRIMIRGASLAAPGSYGTAAAQIRISYHVILENEYTGTGASVGAVNGVNVSTPTQFDSTSLSLTDSGGAPVLSVPGDAVVTDGSVGALTRKEVQGSVVLNDMLSYGPGVLNQIGVTFFSGAQATTGTTASVTAQAASLAGDTAVTDVVSLDPNVAFAVMVPEPGGAALGLGALLALAARSAVRKRDRAARRAFR